MPRNVKVIPVDIERSYLDKAAKLLQAQLGDHGIAAIGGRSWWQWREGGTKAGLKAEWIEMRSDYEARNRRAAADEPEKQGTEVEGGKQNKRGVDKKADRIMLYFHGGGNYFGSVDAHRYQIQRHARKLSARVLAPRYRLAPQFPFPCGLQDCLASYLHLLDQYCPSTILLAGDSAGAGTVVNTLVILRDQGLPMPAGGILLSPWVDLTHSFPSLGEDDSLDYIPSSGFMHKPSACWPPATEEELVLARERMGRKVAKDSQKSRSSLTLDRLMMSGKNKSLDQVDDEKINEAEKATERRQISNRSASNLSLPYPSHVQHPITVELDGKSVPLKHQIQVYAPNHLLNHPLVSPVLHPSLGGLPPLLIQTGGGEIIRDEQIYLAHKAANPSEYLPAERYLDLHDPQRETIRKYPPTDVYLQVWDDMCHVAHTFSYAKPVKLMYKAVAQFGYWALEQARVEKEERGREGERKRGEEDTDDDNKNRNNNSNDKDDKISDMEISNQDNKSSNQNDTERNKSSAPSNPYPSLSPSTNDTATKSKTNTNTTNSNSNDNPTPHPTTLPPSTPFSSPHNPLPSFDNHMIRQRVTPTGIPYPLPPPSELPALKLPREEIGAVKATPLLRRWLEAHERWRQKYGEQREELLAERIREDMEREMEAEEGEKGGKRKKKKKKKEGIAGETEDEVGDGRDWMGGLLGKEERPPGSAAVGRMRMRMGKGEFVSEGEEDEGEGKDKRKRDRYKWSMGIWRR